MQIHFTELNLHGAASILSFKMEFSHCWIIQYYHVLRYAIYIVCLCMSMLNLLKTNTQPLQYRPVRTINWGSLVADLITAVDTAQKQI